MSRPQSLGPKILFAFDQSRSEEPRPETIHRDARGERVGFVGEPLRQAQPGCRSVRGQGVKHRRRGGFHPLALIHEIPAEQDVRLAPLTGRQLAHDQSLCVIAEIEQRLFLDLVGILGLVEKSIKLIELFVRDRIVLVAVALRATPAHAHPNLPRSGHPVFDGQIAKLLVVGSALVVAHRVAMEARGDELIARRHRQQISRQLNEREAVEGHILVQRPDDPIPVGPDGSQPVGFVAFRVGVARQVQPDARPALSVMRRVEYFVDDPLVGAGLSVVHKRLYLFDGRRQPDQIEIDAPNEHCPAGFGRWREPLGVEPRQHERVHLIPRPRRVPHRRRRGANRGLERPVAVVARALVDPPPDEFNLPGR